MSNPDGVPASAANFTRCPFSTPFAGCVVDIYTVLNLTNVSSVVAQVMGYVCTNGQLLDELTFSVPPGTSRFEGHSVITGGNQAGNQYCDLWLYCTTYHVDHNWSFINLKITSA